MIGKYQTFFSNFLLLEAMDKDENETDTAARRKKKALPKDYWSQLKIYFFSKTLIISRLCCCFFKSERLKTLIERVEKSSKKLKSRLNLKRIIVNMARLRRN